MPYVSRNVKGEVTKIHWRATPEAREFLPEDHPEITGFKGKYSEDATMPVSAKEMENRHQQYRDAVDQTETLKEMAATFTRLWGELEIALSALFYELLNRPQSRIAYAIYYAIPGFDTRIKMLNEAIEQFASEQTEDRHQATLLKCWGDLYLNLKEARDNRNTIAHGHIYTLTVRDKLLTRIAAPAFDVNRIERLLKKGSDVGMDTEKLRMANHRLIDLVPIIDAFNRGFRAFHDFGPQSWPDTLSALIENQRKWDTRYPSTHTAATQPHRP